MCELTAEDIKAAGEVAEELKRRIREANQTYSARVTREFYLDHPWLESDGTEVIDEARDRRWWKFYGIEREA